MSGVSTGGVSAADIADAVWDELLTDHSIADSGSIYVRNAGQSLSLIKAQTDKFVFTVANQVDCNVITKTGFSLASSQTFNNTGTWTGNLAGTVSTLTTYTGNTVQTGDAYARLGAPAGASVSADVAAAKTVVDAVKLKTDLLTTFPANFSLMLIDSDGFAEVDAHKMDFAVSGTTQTVKRLSGATKYTKTLTTDAAAEPITGST